MVEAVISAEVTSAGDIRRTLMPVQGTPGDIIGAGCTSGHKAVNETFPATWRTNSPRRRCLEVETYSTGSLPPTFGPFLYVRRCFRPLSASHPIASVVIPDSFLTAFAASPVPAASSTDSIRYVSSSRPGPCCGFRLDLTGFHLTGNLPTPMEIRPLRSIPGT